MDVEKIVNSLENLKLNFDGDILTDNVTRILYSTDASAYREKPVAVVFPKSTNDIKKAIKLAKEHKTHIIPRGAGTSLAGQVVGSGIVLDIGKYMNKIIELNTDEKWIKVQPGVILNELNQYLKPYNLFFGPETSTANRCTLGGMLGNNSCGLHSIVYGSTREHTIEVRAILSDGSEAVFKPVKKEELIEKCKGNTLENKIYQNIQTILSKPENQEEIRKEFPDPSNPRKNTGYALDVLLDSEPYGGKEKFNLCKLIAGSEGTLAFVTEMKLNLVPIPFNNKALVCVHFNSIDESLRGNLIALKHKPEAVELMDDTILNCTKDSVGLQKSRFFIKGNPKAILIIEFARKTMKEIEIIAENLKNDFKILGLGYHFPIITGTDIPQIWNLRKAGLGVLSNVPGDRRSTTVIEDTSVKVEVLPEYIRDFDKILHKHKLHCVYYAHVGSGELHLRPLLNLKDKKDVKLFYTIALEVAKLVKKYKGSLSGEHGDGRLRGEFIPLMIGEQNYQLLKDIKHTWDPDNVFNVGKITDVPSMVESLRYSANIKEKKFDTIFDFSKTLGFLRAIEKCNGSGDCRKSNRIGGTMCPSFMASQDERNTTRARANILREILTYSNTPNPFASKEIYEVLDLCLSCKACKSECPSEVDMTKLKAEFLQHYYDAHGIPLRTRLIGNINIINKLGAVTPNITNFFLSNDFTSSIIKKTLGFAAKRSIPQLSKKPLEKRFKKINRTNAKNTVYLFNDEFTNFNDTEIGVKAILLLQNLGYVVKIQKHKESARTYLSKGLIRKAKKIINHNIEALRGVISEETPLIGIEPSAILSFRDEYTELAEKQNKADAEKLAKYSFLIDEFLINEIKKGNISQSAFTKEKRHFKLHGHCQQKAIASTQSTKQLISFPENYTVEEIPSGCCGMAGSFGYEKEHYKLSMKIGELTLFPAIRNTPKDVKIVAPGTSCRHQIKDGTNRDAIHPVEVLYEALIQKSTKVILNK